MRCGSGRRGSCRRRSARRARRSRPKNPLRGSASTNSTVRGFLYDAMLVRQCSTISVAGDGRGRRATTTIAFTLCTHLASGTPMTAHSATAGCRRDAALDLGRVDVLGGRLDHAALRPDEGDRPVGLAAPRSFVWCQPPRWRTRVLLGPVPVAVHDGRRRGPRSRRPRPAAPRVVVVDDADSSRGEVRPCVPSAPRPRQLNVIMPDGLGLAVAAGVRRPTGSCRGLTIASHVGATGRAAQARQVVAAVGVDLEDLVEHRPDEERAGAALGRDGRGRAPRRRPGGTNTLVPPATKRRERVHERAEVEHRSAVQVHVVGRRARAVRRRRCPARCTRGATASPPFGRPANAAV